MNVKLQEILDALTENGRVLSVPDGLPDVIAGVTDDSRSVEPGFLFCAVEGFQTDGHEFLSQAAQNGAAAAVVTKLTKNSIPQIVVDDSRLAVGVVAAAWFGFPGNEMTLIGITGTNGKSTTASILRHLLNADQSVGLIGTLGAFDGTGKALYREGLTTPGPIQVHETLWKMREQRVKLVVAEVSSHALAQKRVDALSFQVGIFTNLTQDHLDYHDSFEEYLEAKAHLTDLIPAGGVLAINADSPEWAGLKPNDGVGYISFGLDVPADVSAIDLSLNATGAEFTLQVFDQRTTVRVPLIGRFNVSNVLAAVSAATHVGCSLDEIAERLATVPQVDGRMESIASDGWVVLRDYAHTPDALERALAALRPLTRGRLMVLFGCGGDRDRGKRPIMGSVASQNADRVFVTSDNPRTEPPEAIIDEIVTGMKPGSFTRMSDRREAIRQAVEQLEDGDCLLLAGKGHETYQVLGTERIPFDETEIVRDAVAGRRT